MLSVKNMTTSAQFECEAVNEHVWGASVKSKKFNVIVLPNSGKNVKLSAKLTSIIYFSTTQQGLCSVVGNVSGNRCESDCRSRGREIDPGPVPYFRGD